MKPKTNRVPGSDPGDKVPAREWSQFRLRPDLDREISGFSERLFISRTDAINLLLGFAFRQIRGGINPFSGDLSPGDEIKPLPISQNTPSNDRKGGFGTL